MTFGAVGAQAHASLLRATRVLNELQGAPLTIKRPVSCLVPGSRSRKIHCTDQPMGATSASAASSPGGSNMSKAIELRRKMSWRCYVPEFLLSGQLAGGNTAPEVDVDE